LRLQREGAGALGRPEVAKTLGLNDEQQGKIRKILDEARGQRGQGGRFRDMSEEERREALSAMQKRREKTEADVLAVLTSEQSTKWTEMKGAAFEFPARERGFGRQGRGGGDAGPRERPPRKKD
jgi:hypothetical protein